MKFSTPVISLILIGLLSIRAGAAPTMAFDYLINKSNDGNYDYLETIFPNSFASSVQNIIKVNVIKPNQIKKILEKHAIKPQKTYEPHTLSDIASTLSADFFIYGNFIILPRDMIRINLSFYSRNADRIFTFTNTGRMEAEIFKLVDRIAKIMTDFMGKESFFMSQKIPRGSRIGIFTNLDADDLNYLYHSFLTNGYRIAGIQANSLKNDIFTYGITSFECIQGAENAYQMISDPRKMRFLYGPWSGPEYSDTINGIKKMYHTFDTGYLEEKRGALGRLIARHDVDAVIIIGFNDRKSKAWLRCLDAGTKNLIWMQSNISGTLPEICTKIVNTLSSGAK